MQIIKLAFIAMTMLILNFSSRAEALSTRDDFRHMPTNMNGLEHLPNQQQLQIFCDKQQGQMMQNWTCPLSGVTRTDGPFCILSDKIGRVQVSNGCTGTYGIGPQFFKACVLHDFCYHNHAFLNGKAKAGCDDKFLADMYDMCDRTINKTATASAVSCYVLANRLFYNVVQHFGSKSWNCSNGNVEYPQTVDDI